MQFITKIDIKLEGFVVPDHLNEVMDMEPVFFIGERKVKSYTRTFELSEIPTKTLEDMCDKFKREVFKKANKPLPKVTSNEKMS